MCSSDLIFIEAGSPIGQLVFMQLDEPVTGYSGKYQDQAQEPVPALLEDE